MELICPNCNKTYHVWDRTAGDPGFEKTCERCGVPLVPLSGGAATPPEPSMPEGDLIRCPRCGYSQPPAATCRSCGYDLPGTIPGSEAPRRFLPSKEEIETMKRRRRVLNFGAVLGVVLVLCVSLAVFQLALVNSQAFNTTKAFIRENATVRRLAGDNLSFGFFQTGTIVKEKGAGRARFVVRVTGDAGKLRVHVELIRFRSRWRVVSAHCEDERGRTLDLLPKPTVTDPPPLNPS